MNEPAINQLDHSHDSYEGTESFLINTTYNDLFSDINFDNLFENIQTREPIPSLHLSSSPATLELLHNLKASFSSGYITSSDPSESIAFHKFSQCLLDSLYEEPIQEGYFHPAESILEDILRDQQLLPNTAAQWIIDLYNINKEVHPAIAAGILRCLGRIDPNLVGPWKWQLARQALSHEHDEVRDAAVCAFEEWRGSYALFALQRHLADEPADWLAYHIKKLINELAQEVEREAQHQKYVK